MGDPVPVDRTTAVLSIHPQYVNRILAGTKTVELRKQPLPSMVRTVLMWRTGSDGGIVGKFTVDGQERLSVDDLLHLADVYPAAYGLGIEKAPLRAYAEPTGGSLTSIDIGLVERFQCTERFGWTAGPQSFRYAPADWRTVLEVAW